MIIPFSRKKNCAFLIFRREDIVPWMWALLKEETVILVVLGGSNSCWASQICSLLLKYAYYGKGGCINYYFWSWLTLSIVFLNTFFIFQCFFYLDLRGFHFWKKMGKNDQKILKIWKQKNAPTEMSIFHNFYSSIWHMFQIRKIYGF